MSKARYLVIATLLMVLLVPIIAIAWIFVPIRIGIPAFNSPFLSALEEEARQQPTSYAPNETAVIGRLIPTGSNIEDAEKILRREWFSCTPFQDVGAQEAARATRKRMPGEKYRHYKTCFRITSFHPLGHYGWEVDLFANSDDIIESATAQRYYDGL